MEEKIKNQESKNIVVPLKNEVEEQSEVVKYKRPDIEGGFIYNKDELNYYKTVQSTDIIDNCLLGDFDSAGNYNVSKSIVDELIKVNKVYLTAYENSIYCHTFNEYNGYGKIEFRLKILSNTPKEGNTTAILELLETVNKVNGYYQNTNHVSLVGVQFKGETSTEKVFKFFNIHNGEDDGAKVENEKDDEIKNRINRMLTMKKVHVGIMEKYEKDLYKKRIEILKKSKYGAELLEDFNKEYFHVKGKFIKENSPEYYKHLNQLLDSIIERNIDFIKEDSKTYSEIQKLQSVQSTMYNKNYEQVIIMANRVKENESVRPVIENKNNIVEAKTEIKQETKQEIKQKPKQEKNKEDKQITDNEEAKPRPKKREDNKQEENSVDDTLKKFEGFGGGVADEENTEEKADGFAGFGGGVAGEERTEEM